jgi:hypothetical protein
MKWDFIYCMGIYGVPVMGILGVHKSMNMKPSLVSHEKKHWIDTSFKDRL